MKNRSVIIAIAVLCVGIMIMPYTVSLFSTQHGWVAAGDVNCLDCHTDIVEPGAGYMHSSLGTGQAYCKSCHQLSTAGTSSGVTGSGGFDDEHVAATVECLDCHEDEYGATSIDDVWWTPGDEGVANKGFINNATEAHTNMTGNATNSEGAWATDYLSGNNEACIACHTNVTVDVSFVITAVSLNITATENIWGNWSVDFEVNKP